MRRGRSSCGDIGHNRNMHQSRARPVRQGQEGDRSGDEQTQTTAAVPTEPLFGEAAHRESRAPRQMMNGDECSACRLWIQARELSQAASSATPAAHPCRGKNAVGNADARAAGGSH